MIISVQCISIYDENFKIEALETKKCAYRFQDIWKEWIHRFQLRINIVQGSKNEEQRWQKSQKSIDKTMNSRPEIKSEQSLQNQDKR